MFGTMALIIAAGLVGPLGASLHRFAPPVVVGEIVAGVVIGRSGFGWVHTDDSVVRTTANVGFAVLMFIVGTRLPLRERSLRRTLGRGMRLAVVTGALALGLGAVLAPHVGLDRPLVLATLLAASSAAVAVPLLQDLRSNNDAIPVVIAWITILDVVTVLAIPLVLPTGSVVRALGGGALVVAGAIVAFASTRWFTDENWVARLRRMSWTRGWALDLRLSLLVLFTLCWLADRFGTSILIAGFAWGAAVNALGEPRRVAQQLIGLGEGFLVPFFFVDLGAQLSIGDLGRHPRAIVLGAVLLAGAIVAHTLSAFVWRLPPAAGLVASAQVGVPAAIVTIGLNSGRVDSAQAAAIMAAVLGSLLVAAIGAMLLGARRSSTAPISSSP